MRCWQLKDNQLKIMYYVHLIAITLSHQKAESKKQKKKELISHVIYIPAF